VLPPVGQLRTTDRIRVGLEVITNYPAMWRAVRTNDLAHMVATARTTSHRVVTPPEQHAEMAERVGGIVQSAMKVLPTDKRCLVTSLLTLRVLANRSIPGRLVIGVHGGEEFKAHAWVEHESRAVLPRGNFLPLHEL
jgi:hypothetical protein